MQQLPPSKMHEKALECDLLAPNYLSLALFTLHIPFVERASLSFGRI